MTVFRPRAQGAERRLLTAVETGKDPGPDSGPEDRSGAWVFQANPSRYDLLAAMDEGSEDTWSVNQHRQDVQLGDRVWFRITGPTAGIYAVGRITSMPREHSNEFGNWHVDVELEARVEPPLLRGETDSDPVLGSARALKGLMGTNLAITREDDARLEELTESRLTPLSGPQAASRLLERQVTLEMQRLAEAVERNLLDHLRSLSHVHFEEVCALYLRTLGCEEVTVVGAATAGSLGDGGIDVTATLNQPGLPVIRIAVQAKNITGGVGPHVVTQLRGSVGPGTYGMIMTTGHFTRAAISEAARTDRSHIRLIDGAELAHLLADNGIGVRKTPVLIPRLDPDGLTTRLDTERG